MSFKRRTVLYLVLVPATLAAIGTLIWYAVYAGPKAADKLEADFEDRAIEALKYPPYDWARIEMDGHTAIITGSAPTEALRDSALQRVSKAAGPGGMLDGGTITIEDATYLMPPAKIYEFHADKVGNRVTLSGFLPDPDALDRFVAQLAALGVDDPVIVSGVLFRDGMPDDDWLGTAALGLDQLVLLTDGEMTLTDKRLFLSGQAPDSQTRIDILARLTRPPSGYATDADLIGEAVWKARLAGGLLRFSGEMPDERQLDDLVDLTDQLFDGEFTNDMSVAAMAEREWPRAVELALPMFVEFQSGTMLFKGDELEIQGKAGASVLEYLREDMVRSGTSIPVNLRAEESPVPLRALIRAPDTGELPARDICQAALDEALNLGPINFEYSKDEMTRPTGRVLDGVLTVMKACPHFVFEIEASTHADGRRIALKKLTEDRQMAFGSYFIAHGVPLDQIEFSGVVSDGTDANWSGELDRDRQLTVRLME